MSQYVSIHRIIQAPDIPLESCDGHEAWVEPNQETLCLRHEYGSLLAKAISRLAYREQCVIGERYFNDKTLGSIAAMLNLTQERVRQIEARALRKLSNKRNLPLLVSAYR